MLKPINCIPVEEAKQLQKNWIATRAMDIERSQGSIDTRDFLFSVDELQQFLDYIKAGTSLGAKPGVRIYFGANDSESSDRATVFLAPTLGSTAGAANNYMLEPLNRGLAGFPPNNY